jgi:hypothetical protein
VKVRLKSVTALGLAAALVAPWAAARTADALGTVTPAGPINITSGAVCTGASGGEAFPVSITLPTTAVTDNVDLALVLDDTGSFSSQWSAVSSTFSSVVDQLQADLPSVNFGFGVSMFKDYGGPWSFNDADAITTRPFILNQPIVNSATAGGGAALATLISGAVGRASQLPGSGGDGPESSLEALSQLATGAGFDGNGDGTSTESGPASAVLTQTTPGTSGDVPAFSTNVAPASGTLGGVGWRPGALHIAILATDVVPAAAFPAGAPIPTTITSANGDSEPTINFAAASLTPGTGRLGYVSDSKVPADNTVTGSVVPAGGATVQNTVNQLNALGIRVLGMGPVAAPTTADGPSGRPSTWLSTIARLTGGTDLSGTPLVFDTNVDATTLGTAIVDNVETSATKPVNVGITTSDLPSGIISAEPAPATVDNVAPGGTASFNVTIAGDGTATTGAFDINFVDDDSGAILGSVPVTVACSGGSTVAPTTVSTSLSGGGLSGAAVSVPPSTAVTDSATLTGTNAASATGTVAYSVYSDNACTAAVSTGAAQAIVTPGTLPVSNAVSLADVGTYYWQASYSGDTTNAASKSPCGSEIETVNTTPGPPPTSVSTSLAGGGQSGATISVPADTAVADAATLAGDGAASATGTVTYSVYSDNACTTAVNTGTPKSITTPGVLPASDAVTLADSGTYYWQAAYSGDAGNAPSKSTCGSEVETVAVVTPVGPKPTEITTTLSTANAKDSHYHRRHHHHDKEETDAVDTVSGPTITVPLGAAVTDSATLTGDNAASATGTVSYTVYSDSTCVTAVSSGPETIATPGEMPDATPVTLAEPGTYYWQAIYSGDANNLTATSVCGSEVEIVTPPTPEPTSITTSLSGGAWTGHDWNGFHDRDVVTVFAGTAVHDSATLDGANASSAGGTVTYTVYSDIWHHDVVATDSQPVVNGVVSDSADVTLDPGVYFWQATYSGDARNQPSESELGSEMEIVLPIKHPHGRCGHFYRW